MNGHGGKRSGCGRKKGSATEKTREIADRIAEVEGSLSPLEVMNEAMLAHYKAKRLDKAAAIAKDMAPYIHPRLSAIQHDLSYSDADEDAALEAELERLAALRQAAGASPAGDQDRPADHDAGTRNGARSVAGGPTPLF